MRTALCWLLVVVAISSGCVETHIAGITVTGAKAAVSETDIREAIAAGTDFGGQWGSTGRFRVTVVQVISHDQVRLFQEPHGQSWVTVTRKSGKWKYDGFTYVDA